MENETTTSTTAQVRENLDCRRQEWHSRRKAQRQAVLNKTRIYLEESKSSEVTAQQLKEIINKFKKKGEVDVAVLRKLQQALSQGDKNINEVLQHEWVLPALISVLTGKKPEHALEAAGCLTNLTVSDHHATYRVAKAAGAYLLTLVSSSSPLTQEQCLWTLGNIAADCPVCCDLLLQQGFVPVCWSAMASPYPSTVEAATLTVSSFLRHTWNKENVLNCEKVQQLASFTKTCVSRGLCWSLFYISCSSRFDAIISQPEFLQLIMDRLSRLTEDEKVNVAVITPLIRFLGNVASISEGAAAVIVNHPEVEALLKRSLSSCYNHIIKETVWLIGNIAAKNPSCPSTAALVGALTSSLEKANNVLNFQGQQI